MSHWTLIPATSLVAAPWRNGHGTSRDIAHGDGWTVSIAELDHDAPFSHYPHTDRIFTPIAGDPPPQLAFEGRAFEPCPLLVPKHFPGDIETTSRIPSPGRAFNALVDRRRFTVDVQVLRLAAGDPIHVPDAGVIVLHCLAGRIAAVGELLAAGDSIRGVGPADPAAAAEDSVAVLVAIRSI